MANEKHIFIGIGGSGCQTVSQIKQKVYEKRFPEATKSKSRLQAMNDSYRFIFLDTDQRDIDEANKRNRVSFEGGKVPFISPQTDLVNLGRANPHAIYYEAKQDPHTLMNKRILEACSAELATKIPDQPLAFGAGAFRMKSRIAFAHSLADFQSKVQAAISSLNDVKTVGGEDCIIYYWVVGSTLGGTGSGIFNDVLYHLNQIHHQVVGNGDPQLVLTMYMPKVYIDSNATEEKYALNAFGVFQEVEAFKAMSFDSKQNTVMHRLAFQNDYSLINSDKRYCPFYYLIPIDIQTDKGTSLGTTRTMYSNTAEMLYHLHNGKAGATFRSDIDNYMNDIMERNHKDFLVPMGYVSLQKPIEFFNKYIRARFRRDVLCTWLLAEDGKGAKVDPEQLNDLEGILFRELVPEAVGTIAHRLAHSPAVMDLEDALANQTPDKSELVSDAKLSAIEDLLNSFAATLETETKVPSKRDENKKVIVNQIWAQAEKWIRTNGFTFAHDAVDEIRKKMSEDFRKAEKAMAEAESKLNEDYEALQGLFKEADELSGLEKLDKNRNKVDIQAYIQALTAYIEDFKKLHFAKWANNLKKDFCTDEKNDELALLKKHIATFKDKVSEMNRTAIGEYKKLASAMGQASMDVTTVYLPQLTTIADGNGWIKDNFFSRLYTTLITAQQDESETPERADLEKLISNEIYNAVNDDIIKEIKKGQYQVCYNVEDSETKKIVPVVDTRFFCNPNLERASEQIIDEFLNIAVALFERKVREDQSITERWDTKKISAFFNDLTNEQKDNVRRNLNPALFFSYNANRIDVVKKEEHVVFVAGNEDLATEMLGFQKGNPKHRFEVSDNENTALVLKSKYGLSLADYRIYDSIKMVYDKATFREKYHFHHDFAQFLDKLTINDLPEEVLPQHRTYAKMLMLKEFREETKEFFYVDEYDQESYTDTMFYEECSTSSMIATAEALTIHPEKGQIILKKNDNGRLLFKELEGVDFPAQFVAYRDFYYNYRFGETTEAILQAILRQSTKDEKGNTITGEQIFKQKYEEKHKALLIELSQKRNNAKTVSEKRLYNVLFGIVREELGTVHKFIK